MVNPPMSSRSGLPARRKEGVSLARSLVIGAAGALRIGLRSLVIRQLLDWRGPAAQFGSHRAVLGTTALAVVLANAVPALLVLLPALARADAPRAAPSLWLFLLAGSSMSATLLALTYFAAVRSGLLGRPNLSLRLSELPKLVLRGVWVGIGLLILSATVQLGLREVGVVQTQLQAFAWIRNVSSLEFVLLLIMAAGLAPIAEEFFFRGYVFGSYARRYSPATAGVLSSLLFAALHFNLAALAPILVMGVALAWLYNVSGSLVPGIVAHGVNNAAAMAVLYFGVS